MIVRQLKDIDQSDRRVEGKTWISRRLLLKSDNMGFSMHDTIIKAGTETHLWYQSHLEAVYCVEGKGSIYDKKADKNHVIEPGTIYALDQNDAHILRAESDLRLVCVFNPPLIGPETHDENGSYPILGES